MACFHLGHGYESINETSVYLGESRSNRPGLRRRRETSSDGTRIGCRRELGIPSASRQADPSSRLGMVAVGREALAGGRRVREGVGVVRPFSGRPVDACEIPLQEHAHDAPIHVL